MIRKLTLLLLLLTLTLVLTSCKNSKVEEPPIVVKPDHIVVNYDDFEDLGIQKDTPKLFIDGTEIQFKLPIYIDKNRYLLSLNEIMDTLGGKIKRNEENGSLDISVFNKAYNIDLTSKLINVDNKNINLKKDLLVQNDFYYISLIDLSNMFNMYTYWDRATNSIYCTTNDTSFKDVAKYVPKVETLGFLRLEDVTPYLDSGEKDYFNKLRVIGKYLSSTGVPYHIAWIPRSVDPQNKSDLDPLTQNSFILAESIYSLDYFTYNLGIIGLHGYTHQSDNEVTGLGTEFGYKQPDLVRFRERLLAAINTAKELDIPVNFFEAPHYAITPDQNKIAEEYFKYIYHPFSDNGIKGRDLTKPQLSPYNKTSYYFSAPLEYVAEANPLAMIPRIKNESHSHMGSLFFHPRLDYKFIAINMVENKPSYTYAEDSVLHQVINALNERGYKMSSVTDIK
ncbi:MAG: DUF2334 domain-containing protein [Clostridium sp.]